MPSKVAKVSLFTAISFVIANMIGTGVFTSLGFQLIDTQDLFSIIMLWLIGGVIALFGAFVYGELGVVMPRSGGEYNYLSKIYHPSVGFLSGWVSMTVGFAAPVAAACVAFSKYFSSGFESNTLSTNFNYEVIFAIALLIIITLVHSFSIKTGSRFQNFFTVFKIILIIVIVICGFSITPNPQHISILPTSKSISSIFSGAFAVSLVWVTYSYSGWNASAYIAGDIDNPQKKLPLSLFYGTLIVTFLYLILNYTFLNTASIADLTGKPEVGFVSANNIFGVKGGHIIAFIISFLLISTISSMVFVGPRVTQVMGEDYKILKTLSFKTSKGVPLYAIIFQSAISLVFILTSSFQAIITYVGFTLNFFTTLTVIGLFVHRYRFKNIERPYKTFGYPFVPAIFIALMLWILVYLLIEKPFESICGLITLALGLIIYFIDKYISKPK